MSKEKEYSKRSKDLAEALNENIKIVEMFSNKLGEVVKPFFEEEEGDFKNGILRIKEFILEYKDTDFKVLDFVFGTFLYQLEGLMIRLEKQEYLIKLLEIASGLNEGNDYEEDEEIYEDEEMVPSFKTGQA